MKNSISKNSKEATSSEAKEISKPQSMSVFDKSVLDTFEDFYRFASLFKRPGAVKKPCVVSADLFDMLTEGDVASPLFWKDNVPVVDDSRKEHAFSLLGSSSKIDPVIVK